MTERFMRGPGKLCKIVPNMEPCVPLLTGSMCGRAAPLNSLHYRLFTIGVTSSIDLGLE